MSTSTKPAAPISDLLSVDAPIAGQNFACLSFLSPEKIIRRKEEFFFNEFVKQWDMAKSVEKFQKFVGFLSLKYECNSAR